MAVIQKVLPPFLISVSLQEAADNIFKCKFYATIRIQLSYGNKTLKSGALFTGAPDFKIQDDLYYLFYPDYNQDNSRRNRRLVSKFEFYENAGQQTAQQQRNEAHTRGNDADQQIVQPDHSGAHAPADIVDGK